MSILRDGWPSAKGSVITDDMPECMLDLETWGQRPGCAIRSIGAVMFNRKKCIPGAEFYCNITDSSNAAAGLHKDPDTVKWWARQSGAAQAGLLQDQIELDEGVKAFIAWFKAQKGVRVWCLGATFDAPVIEAAMHALKLSAPWKFWNVRCVRTHYDLHDFDPKMVDRKGTYHNALDDAKHQVLCMRHAQL